MDNSVLNVRSVHVDNMTVTAASVYALLSEDIVSYILYCLTERDELENIYKDTYPEMIKIYINTLELVDANVDIMCRRGLLRFHVDAVQSMLEYL